jgi:hypothetical protein
MQGDHALQMYRVDATIRRTGRIATRRQYQEIEFIFILFFVKYKKIELVFTCNLSSLKKLVPKPYASDHYKSTSKVYAKGSPSLESERLFDRDHDRLQKELLPMRQSQFRLRA